MKASEALNAQVANVLAIPNHYILVRLVVPYQDDDLDMFCLVNLGAIPATRHLVGNWQAVREVRISPDQKALLWPSSRARVPASWLIVADLSRTVTADELMQFTLPVRRRKRIAMH